MAKETHEDNALSQSLVYLVSGRGDNNYWARVINGCDKVYPKDFGTCAVMLTSRGRFTLAADLDWLNARSARMRKLVLIHEAGHISLRHIERSRTHHGFLAEAQGLLRVEGP